VFAYDSRSDDRAISLTEEVVAVFAYFGPERGVLAALSKFCLCERLIRPYCASVYVRLAR